jgi:hypothetical protein
MSNDKYSRRIQKTDTLTSGPTKAGQMSDVILLDDVSLLHALGHTLAQLSFS